MERRVFLVGPAALGLLTACGATGPGSVTIAASGAAGMNKAADGTDRPVTLMVIQMRGTGAFDTADYFALQNPSAALGADFVSADTIALAPGGSASKTITLDGTTVAVGVVAGFINPAGKIFRAKAPVSAKGAAVFTVSVGAGGLTLSAK